MADERFLQGPFDAEQADFAALAGSLINEQWASCLTRFGRSNTGGDPRKRAEGLRLVATNLDWSAGEGPQVRGSGEAIMMAITGRTRRSMTCPVRAWKCSSAAARPTEPSRRQT